MKKQNQKQKVKKRKISNFFSIFFFITSLIILVLANYIIKEFNDVTIEQLIYSLTTAEGTSADMIINGFIYVILRIGIVCVFLILIFKLCKKYIFKYNTKFILSVKNKRCEISLVPFSKKLLLILSIIFFGFSIYYSLKLLGFIDYISPGNYSTYIEENYVNPKKVKITAPEEKQNLIFLYVESLESSFFSNANGGNFKESIIPNLEEIALNNISFSNTDYLGGASADNGATWTIAGMVASTSGIPLKLAIGGNNYSGYGEFLPGAYSLGDVLKKNGYQNYLLIGSDANFAGRKDYFTYHGSYNIKDYNYAKKKGWIDKNYRVWWGYEDSKLFEFAKKELLEISKNDEPFNYTMLTTNTHSTDGYVEKSCETPFKEKYLNAYNCSDSMIGEFIEWIKEQDFYDNTTIVIVGDHTSMQGNIYELFNSSNTGTYSRRVYNAYINSKVETDNVKNRKFATFDYYPTTLAALGFDIEGERLGLGTNLFSSEKTLLEEEENYLINIELSKKSKFYNEKILKRNLFFSK